MQLKAGFIMVIAVLMNACASTGEKVAEIPRIANEDIEIHVSIDKRSNGSIYGSPHTMNLYEDNKASRVGDIITIILSEETSATKSTSTSTSKDNNLNIDNPILSGAALSLAIPSMLPFGGRSIGLDALLSTSRNFSGEGESEQSNKMSGTISALITKVLANGYLVISGKKKITINNGDEYIHITGVVRPRDISGDNSVYSNKIANAEISYSGTGMISKVNEAGWLTRFFNSKWWPL